MKRIDQMFAFVAEDEAAGMEGIVSWQFGNNHMPLVGADTERVESLKPYAKRIEELSGKKVKLIKFSQREEVPL